MCFCDDPCKTPPLLCDFEQWIDTEIKLEDKEEMQYMLRWAAENKERMEKRLREKVAEKEHKEEEERRRVAAEREERVGKLERARRAKAAIEENPDALRESSPAPRPRLAARYAALVCCWSYINSFGGPTSQVGRRPDAASGGAVAGGVARYWVTPGGGPCGASGNWEGPITSGSTRKRSSIQAWVLDLCPSSMESSETHSRPANPVMQQRKWFC
uniref:Uncharacterized protein n=1 Tax=Setaria viridis TaxID=4556 RepID=A0A4V6DCM8_SETVI|nr:hypothetical protein SEVIR_1G047300v2 [Setaria viridis]